LDLDSIEETSESLGDAKRLIKLSKKRLLLLIDALEKQALAGEPIEEDVDFATNVQIQNRHRRSHARSRSCRGRRSASRCF